MHRLNIDKILAIILYMKFLVLFVSIHCVSKNIPDICDCNLKTNIRF